MEFWPYFNKHWNSYLIHPLQTLKSTPCPSKHWNSGPIFIHIGILILSTYTFKFWPVFFFVHIVFLMISFKTLGFGPYFYKHWHYDLVVANFILRNIAILALSVYPLKFLSYRSKPWNSGPIFMHIGILTSSFQAQEF